MTTDEKIDELVKSHYSLAGDVREYITVTRRHIAEQQATNRRLQQVMRDQAETLADLEQWKASLGAVLPKRWLDADAVDAKLKQLEGEVATLKGQVRDAMVKWGLIATGVMFILQNFGPPLAKLVMKTIGVTP